MADKVQVLDKNALRQLSVVQPSLEILDWHLYDTLTILSGGSQTQFTFFQQAIGQGGITKETTNMTLPSQLPSGHRMVVEKVILEVIPTAALGPSFLADVVAPTHNGYAEFAIGGRNYLEVPNKVLIGGYLFGFAGADAATSYAQGKSLISGKLDYMPTIPSTFNFGVTLTFPAAPTLSANVKARVYLSGKLVRPRQG